MTRFQTLTSALMLGLLTATAHAQTDRGTNTPRIDRREAAQDRRVEQGESSGALTTREGNRLERRDSVQDKAADKAAADGSVTAKERKVLRGMERRTSRATYRQKHDGQTAN